MYKINAIPIKNQQHFFTEQVILKFLQNYRKPQLQFVKKNKAGGIICPDFKPYHKYILIKH